MDNRNRCALNAYRRVQRFVDEHPTGLTMRSHAMGWMLLEDHRDAMERFANGLATTPAFARSLLELPPDLQQLLQGVIAQEREPSQDDRVSNVVGVR